MSQSLKSPTVQLPPEVLLEILSFIPYHPSSQNILYNFCLVSRSWYSAAISRLYHTPLFTGKNYLPLVSTICPSINAHIRKSELAKFVRRLDMSRLVHDGSRSLTGRLLGRVKEGLEEFVAPQSSFAVNSLAALGKCHNLRVLDLSFICISLDLHHLMRAISSLHKLEVFHFPRCSPLKDDYRDTRYDDNEEYLHCWYPSLKALYIPSSLSDGYLPAFRSVPLSMTSLTIENSSHVADECLMSIASALGHQVHSLKLHFGGHEVMHGGSSLSIVDFPNLRHLGLVADHRILRRFLGDPDIFPSRSQLESITLYSDCIPADFDVLCIDELFEQAEYLPALKLVVATMRAGSPRSEMLRADLISLRQLLEALESERADKGAAAKHKHSRTGVWIFDPKDLPAQY